MFPVPEASVPAKDICNFQVRKEKQKKRQLNESVDNVS